MARVLPARGALPLIFLLKRAKAQSGETVSSEVLGPRFGRRSDATADVR
jgi:hypothetical protein